MYTGTSHSVYCSTEFRTARSASAHWCSLRTPNMQLSANLVPAFPASNSSGMFSSILLSHLLLDSRLVIELKSWNYFGLASLARSVTMAPRHQSTFSAGGEVFCTCDGLAAASCGSDTDPPRSVCACAATCKVGVKGARSVLMPSGRAASEGSECADACALTACVRGHGHGHVAEAGLLCIFASARRRCVVR